MATTKSPESKPDRKSQLRGRKVKMPDDVVRANYDRAVRLSRGSLSFAEMDALGDVLVGIDKNQNAESIFASRETLRRALRAAAMKRLLARIFRGRPRRYYGTVGVPVADKEAIANS